MAFGDHAVEPCDGGHKAIGIDPSLGGQLFERRGLQHVGGDRAAGGRGEGRVFVLVALVDDQPIGQIGVGVRARVKGNHGLAHGVVVCRLVDEAFAGGVDEDRAGPGALV